MWVVNYRKLFYSISGILVIASFVSLATWGLKPGIDFVGGTLVDVQYQNGRPDQTVLATALTAIDASSSVRPSGADEYIVRLKPVDQAQKAIVMSALSLNGTASTTIKTFDSIGPVLGAEALRKALVSIFLVLIGIVLFITFAFRKVSEPVSSWKYGLTAIIALAHEVIIPAGVFSILGHYARYPRLLSA